MLVSTTVVSMRRRRPRTRRCSRPRATSRASTSLSTGSSTSWASRISVFASRTRSPSIRQKARYTKLPRTSRSHSSKTPVVEVLEDQHPQDHRGGRPQSAPALTLRMALGQGLHDAIDEDLVFEQRVDPLESGIPELVGVGQEHFYEATLPVRSPHHGASGEAAWPQRLHRVSCAAARRVRSRCSLT